MIQRRLKKRVLLEENEIWPKECGEKLWLATFCVGE